MSKKVCVVIGGGVIGASSAYYLTHSSHLGPDDEIYLIEEIELGAGASGKSGGFLALDWLVFQGFFEPILSAQD